IALRLCFSGLVLSFFFQAEDGIRDPLVTGVQTCALPIYAADANARLVAAAHAARQATGEDEAKWPDRITHHAPLLCAGAWRFPRSEERRVGKACSCRGGQYDCTIRWSASGVPTETRSCCP